MGTNYYLHENVCEHCGRGDDSIHIGKSSAGWCFSLHVINEAWEDDKIINLELWKAKWAEPGTIIKNEYGEIITQEKMLAIITERGREKDWEKEPVGYRNWREFHKMNESEQGPNGLLRHRIGRYCMGHGEGTWDLIPGEFS